MKVLVFGAGGYIGRHLVVGLRTLDGFEVFDAGTREGSMDAKNGQIAEEFAIPLGTETVIYLSQSPYWRDGTSRFDHVLAVNCGAAVRLADMAQRAGVKHFLYTSTGTVYRPSPMALSEAAPLNRKDWYALSKLFAEEALLNMAGSMRVSCLRLFGVYGPRQEGRLIVNLAKRILAGQPVTVDHDPLTGRADGLRSTMTYIDDLVAVLKTLVCSERLAPVLNLASDQTASIRELALGVGQILGRSVEFEETGRTLEGHFVADITAMQRLVEHRFFSVQQGLAAIGGPTGMGFSS